MTKPARGIAAVTTDDATTTTLGLRDDGATRTVSAPVRQIPNALTLIRFAAIPLFIWLLLDERSGPSWPAGIVFGLAAITDQLDGYLARRWHVESQFGKVADPLADRLMIDTAVVMLVAFDRLPWVALIILLRDLLLVGGYKLVVPRGYEFEVSRLGQDRHLGALRVDRARARDGEGHLVARSPASGSASRSP